MADLSLRAVLEGFREGSAQVEGLAKSLDKVKESADRGTVAGKSAGEAMKDMTRGAEEASGGLDLLTRGATLAAAAVGSALVAGVALLGKQALDGFNQVRQLGDQLHNLAQTTGLSVEKLGGLQLAAQTSNLSIEQLSQGMNQFNRRLIDATKGSGEAHDAFARLGVQIRGQGGLLKNNEQLLGEVADKFAGLKDGASKTALAMDLFGRAGAQLIPLLNEGSAGLRQLEEEARKAGIVLSAETAEAANKLNANMTVLKAHAQGFWMEIASPVVEGLAKITTAMRQARLEGEGWVSALWRGAGQAMSMLGMGLPGQTDQMKLDAMNIQLQRKYSALADARSRGDEGMVQGLMGEINATEELRNNLQAVVSVSNPVGGIEAEIAAAGGKRDAPEKENEAAARAAKAEREKFDKLSLKSATEDLMAQQKSLEERDELIRKHVLERLKIEQAARDQDSKSALNALRRREEAEREITERAEKEFINQLRARTEGEQASINTSIVLTRQQKIEHLEALKARFEAESAGNISALEANKTIREIEKDLAKLRRENAEEYASIMGKSTMQGTEAFRGFAKSVQGVLGEVLRGHTNASDQIDRIWKGLWGSILDEFARVMASEMLKPIFTPFKKLFEETGQWVKETVFDNLWSYIKTGFNSLVSFLGDVDWSKTFSSLVSVFASAFDVFGDFFSADFFAATGLDIIVTKPTKIIAGEAGPEHVKITPLGQGGTSGQTGQGSMPPAQSDFTGFLSNKDFARLGLAVAMANPQVSAVSALASVGLNIGIGKALGSLANAMGLTKALADFKGMVSNFFSGFASIPGISEEQMASLSEAMASVSVSESMAEAMEMGMATATGGPAPSDNPQAGSGPGDGMGTGMGGDGMGGSDPWQTGGEFIASKPTKLLVGEVGPEFISIDPLANGGGRGLGRPGRNGSTNGQIVFNAPVFFDPYAWKLLKRELSRG